MDWQRRLMLHSLAGAAAADHLVHEWTLHWEQPQQQKDGLR